MENKKYYTPDIEDLYIGYECERKKNIGWVSCVMDFYDMQMVIIDNRPDWYRVPYLTKEQIETEGFQLVSAGHYAGNEEFVKDTISVRLRLKLRTLYINDKIKHISISLYDWSGLYYRGDCPSINEFRKIIKLLGIDGK